MKRHAIALSTLIVLAAMPVLAQNPVGGTKPEGSGPAAGSRPVISRSAPPASYPVLSPGELQATPEMWFYEQSMRQYMDPKMAVRQAAEFRADQRQRRLAAMKWFGLSNQRPQASPDPINGDYSPGWVSNNDTYPYRWTGAGVPWIAVRPDGSRAY